MKRRKVGSLGEAMAASRSNAGWETVVVTASKQVYTRDYGGVRGQQHFFDSVHGRADDKARVVECKGEIAVRLRYNGEDQMTLGTVLVMDEEFEDKVSTLRAAGDEKAAALRAVGAVGT